MFRPGQVGMCAEEIHIQMKREAEDPETRKVSLWNIFLNRFSCVTKRKQKVCRGCAGVTAVNVADMTGEKFKSKNRTSVK